MTKILVIDDDRDFNQLICDFLRDRGYSVSAAYNGRDGMARFEQDYPDIVVSDIRMPKKDGLDLLLKFRNHPDHQPRGIILMSGLANSGSEAYQSTLKTLGAFDFLQKPFPLQDLATKIERLRQEYAQEHGETMENGNNNH